MNYIKKYYKDIKSGKVLVGKKITKQYERLIRFLEFPKENFIKQYDGKKEFYYFNESKANKIIEFIEQFCKHVKGPLAGQLIKLELWQKAMISALYGFVNVKNDFRKYKRLHLYIGRKNGKTLLAACIIIYEMLLGGELGAECYTGATKRDQAKIAWDMAKLIIRTNPVLLKRFRLTVHGIYTLPYSDSFFQPISKESKKLDGLNAQVSHIDELHAITDNNIIDVMWDSSKARTQPIEIITTTMGTERQSTFDEIYDYDSKVVGGLWNDDRLLVFCYELDNANEWKEIKNAFKANPNLGISQSINGLYEEIEKAKTDKTKLVNLLCKTFNIRQTNRHAWLTFDELNIEAVYDLSLIKNEIKIGGFDLSKTGDLTAFTTLHFDKVNKRIVAETMYWVTQKYVDEMKKVPFARWIEDGYARISGEEIIDYHDITRYVLDKVEKGYVYQYIDYDRWSATYLVNELEAEGFAKKYCLIPVAQGAITLSVPMQELAADIKQRKISYQNNPVTKWCLSNVEEEIDKNENIKPTKGQAQQKIDGVSTILNCYVSYIEHASYFWEED